MGHFNAHISLENIKGAYETFFSPSRLLEDKDQHVAKEHHGGVVMKPLMCTSTYDQLCALFHPRTCIAKSDKKSLPSKYRALIR